MKTLFGYVLALGFTCSALANNCEILKPNQTDRNNYYCSGTSFGVTYNGYMVDSKCYSTLKEAMKAKSANSACEMEAKRKNCRILFPKASDNAKFYCPEGFSVTYNRYIADSSCFAELSQAMKHMEMLYSCDKKDSFGDLKILYPKQMDANKRYCSEGFSVAYEGYGIDDVCHTSVDSAMKAMENF